MGHMKCLLVLIMQNYLKQHMLHTREIVHAKTTK